MVVGQVVGAELVDPATEDRDCGASDSRAEDAPISEGEEVLDHLLAGCEARADGEAHQRKGNFECFTHNDP